MAHPKEVVGARIVLFIVDHSHLDRSRRHNSWHHDWSILGHFVQVPIQPVQDVWLVEGHDENVGTGAHDNGIIVSHSFPLETLQHNTF